MERARNFYKIATETRVSPFFAFVLGVFAVGISSYLLANVSVNLHAVVEAATQTLTLGNRDTGVINCNGGRITVVWQNNRQRLTATCTMPTASPTQPASASPSPTPTIAALQTPAPQTDLNQPAAQPGDSSVSFAGLDPLAVSGYPGAAGGCSPAVHDRYRTTGADGRTYRSWHPLTVWTDDTRDRQYMNGSVSPNYITNPLRHGTAGTCSFGHEHGDPPLAVTKPSTGAPMPAFGIANIASGKTSLEPHPGFKVFTHLSENLSGWRTAENPGPKPGDWDMEIVLHQGSPSRIPPSIQNESTFLPQTTARDTDPGVTRLTQRFHELQFWSRTPQGRVTDIKLMGDTGLASNKCGPDVTGAGRSIVSVGPQASSNNHDECAAYEVWEFAGSVGSVWSATIPAAVTNPMDHIHGAITGGNGSTMSTDLRFMSSATEICANQIFGACSQKLPFGHPDIPAWGFTGAMRSLDAPAWTWRNGSNTELFCTDAYGVPQSQSPGQCTGPGRVLQRVHTGNESFVPSPTNKSFFLRNTDDPSWSKAFPTDRLPVGAPLGN